MQLHDKTFGFTPVARCGAEEVHLDWNDDERADLQHLQSKAGGLEHEVVYEEDARLRHAGAKQCHNAAGISNQRVQLVEGTASNQTAEEQIDNLGAFTDSSGL